MQNFHVDIIFLI